MQIKPYDPALTTNPASARPSDVAQLTAQTQQLIEGLARAAHADSVSLSSAVRSLTKTLSLALPTLDPARIFELLTPSDRFVLVRALELVEHERLDAKEVQRLLIDLVRYRAAERTVAGTSANEQLDTKTTRALTAALPAKQERTNGAERDGQRLTLASFDARDEALARRILTSYALRETAIDPGFVRALIDPDRTPSHAVDFAFLRRLVVALSPSQSESADGTVSLAPRAARTQLAEAFARLALTARDLPVATRETLAQGRALLKQRLALLNAGAASERRTNPLFSLLRSADRSVLGMLYAAAAQKRSDPRAVDDVARALIELRTAERALRTSHAGLASRVAAPNDDQSMRKALSDTLGLTPAQRAATASGAPRAAMPSVTPQAAMPSVAPRAATPGVTPQAASASMTPQAAAASVMPRAAMPSVTPPTAAPSTPASPASQAPKLQPGAQTPEPMATNVRARPSSGTYTRASLMPSAFPSALSGGAGAEPELGHALATELGKSDSLMPPTARSFGSASQLAARAAGSYRSLAPPPSPQHDTAMPPDAAGLAPLAAALTPSHVLDAPLNAQPASTLARPLDLGQALGLGALLDQARAHKKLPKRLRLPAQDRSVHGVSPAHAAPSEAEADDPLLGGGTRRERRRVRWQLLIQRRKRARERRA